MNVNIATKTDGVSEHSAAEFNTTITSLNSKADRPSASTLTSGTTIAVDLGTLLAGSKGIFRVSLAHNATLQNPTNGYDGQRVVFKIAYTGDFIPSWGTNYRFSDTHPKPDDDQYSRANGTVDHMIFEYDAVDGKLDCRGFYKNVQ